MRFLLRFLFVGLCAGPFMDSARATDFVWPGHGTIRFEVPDSWNMVGRQAADVGYAFNAKPKSGAAAKLQISLLAKEGLKPVEAAELQKMLQRTVQEYLSGSVEKSFSPQPLPLSQGVGFFMHLTDRSLVGKPPRPGDYKAMRNAVAALDPTALVVITIQFDEAQGPELADMMAMVRSMTFDRAAKRGALTATPRTDRFEFSVPESKLILRIPSANLSADTTRIGGGTNNPRYFKLSDATTSRILSGWFEPAARYDGIKKFWRNESAALAQSGFKPEGVEFAQIGPWEVVHYFQTLSPDVHMCHVRAELSRAGTWIDLHFSATGSEPLAELRQRLTALLSSIEIAEK